MMAVIRTVAGDIPVETAGPVYTHEHLIIDTPLVADTMPHIHLHSVDDAVSEVEMCVDVGVGTMIDAMPAASGRQAERLRLISARTGMHIVAATGLHTSRYYEAVPWTVEETPDQLALRFVADIEEGIDRYDYLGAAVDRTGVRAGIVKVAGSVADLTSRDERLFEAAAITHSLTGAPILTHTEGGVGGVRQIEKLIDLGLDGGCVALSHTDKVPDYGYHTDMLEAGVFLCYDQALRDPGTTMHLVEAMIERGFESQIVMGTDGARRSLWTTLGGEPGLASLYPTVTAVLGVDVSETLFVSNPARYLVMRR